MFSKSLTDAADLTGASTPGRHWMNATAPQAAVPTTAASMMPPLQWWRRLPAETFIADRLTTLRNAFAVMAILGKPRRSEAVRGCPAAIIGIALRIAKAADTPIPIVDMATPTVLIAAIVGDAAAVSVSITMIGRKAAKAEQARLQRSWFADRHYPSAGRRGRDGTVERPS